MTSVATVVGHFPLVIASGAGAAARNSIGITLVTGMVVGTVFTLFVVPVLYVVISRPKAMIVENQGTATTLNRDRIGGLAQANR
jgi:multidrug efflux pump